MPHDRRAEPPLDRPDDLPAAFARAWNARDPDGIAALFAPDAWFVNVTGLRWTHRDAIRRAHAYGLERIFADSTLDPLETHVRPLGEEAAVVQARMRLTGQSPPPGETVPPGPRTTIFTFVTRRDADGWSCVAAQNTDEVRGAETYLRDPDGSLRPAGYRDEPRGRAGRHVRSRTPDTGEDPDR